MADDKSTAESLRATRTYGQVRCMNPSCEGRITPAPGQTQSKCPKCGSEWRIFWIKKGFPRVKGPVWETSQKLANEKLAQMAAAPAAPAPAAKAEKKEGK
jgi:predicted RNA-binding Zn-ribbon protein involved in translation (DUF1610 family)